MDLVAVLFIFLIALMPGLVVNYISEKQLPRK